MDAGNIFQPLAVGFAGVDANLTGLIHLVGVLPRSCNQVDGELPPRLSPYFVFIVTAQAVQPDLLGIGGGVFLLEGRDGTSFRVDTDQQAVASETLKHDPVVSFRPGQDRCTL